MAPFRMPFGNRRGPVTNGPEPNNDENARPGQNGAPIGTESVALASKSTRDQPDEYKMSCQSLQGAKHQLSRPLCLLTTLTTLTVVNDSGIYLPV